MSDLLATLDKDGQFAGHAPAQDRRVGDCRQAISRHIIDDVQNAESSAAGELVVDEIRRPARVGDRLNQDRRPRPYCVPPRPSLARHQALLAIEPVGAVDAGRFAVPGAAGRTAAGIQSAGGRLLDHAAASEAPLSGARQER
jgi:hypothetical protein